MSILLYILFIAILAFVYWFGGIVIRAIGRGCRSFIERLPRRGDPLRLTLILNGGILVLAVILCIWRGVRLGEIIDSLLPFDTYSEIIGQLGGDEERSALTLVLDTLGQQLLLTTMNFIPFFLFEFCVQAVISIFCAPRELSPGEVALEYAVGVCAVGAVNGIVLSSGRMFIILLRDIAEEMSFTAETLFGGNPIRLVIWLIVAFFAVYQIVHSTLTNDTVLAFIGVNAFAALFGGVEARHLWLFFPLAIVCGLGVRFLRTKLRYDEDTGHMTDALIGLGNVAGTALVSWGVFSLVQAIVA